MVEAVAESGGGCGDTQHGESPEMDEMGGGQEHRSR